VNRYDKLKKYIKHAFSFSDGLNEVTEDDYNLLDRLAGFVVRRKMAVPATMFLESVWPLNFVGSSIMSFFRPTLGFLFNRFEYERIEKLLEKRCSIKLLIDRIEKCENDFKRGRAQKCLKSMS